MVSEMVKTTLEKINVDNKPYREGDRMFVLEKSQGDPFSYLVRTKSGCTFIFTEALIKKKEKTVLITGIGYYSIPNCNQDFVLERGVEIKLDEIEFMVDAPFGS